MRIYRKSLVCIRAFLCIRSDKRTIDSNFPHRIFNRGQRFFNTFAKSLTKAFCAYSIKTRISTTLALTTVIPVIFSDTRNNSDDLKKVFKQVAAVNPRTRVTFPSLYLLLCSNLVYFRKTVVELLFYFFTFFF